MAVHVVYARADGHSCLAPVTVRSAPEYGDPPLSTPGWRTLVWDIGPLVDPFHTSKGCGSFQLVLEGALRIRVTGGSLREAIARPGDAFVFVDTQGQGHEASRLEGTPLTALNLRFPPDWDAVRQPFADWPEEAVPFPAPNR
ncbi:hypothetical protein [Novosphingobium sp. BW1]|uniref:hypothetical protein n=1 Tax=Novosphingobium sp. BW1 TaxID=2592621 RepID=UPI0011DECD17|nr:hypothetical protein [Novosphingobium sp. BW1]TYC86114.1 hypothetical protein FMM79_15590 [Novosphingobium sp. BW1]